MKDNLNRGTDAQNFLFCPFFCHFSGWSVAPKLSFITMKSLLFLLLASPSLVVGAHEPHVERPNPPPTIPTACVKVAIFDNPHCWGNPKQEVKYPTYNKPGHSPCCKFCTDYVLFGLIIYLTPPSLSLLFSMQWPTQPILGHPWAISIATLTVKYSMSNFIH